MKQFSVTIGDNITRNSSKENERSVYGYIAITRGIPCERTSAPTTLSARQPLHHSPVCVFLGKPTIKKRGEEKKSTKINEPRCEFIATSRW